MASLCPVTPKSTAVLRLLLHVLGLRECEVADNHYHKEDHEDDHNADDEDPPHVDNPTNDRLDLVRGQEVQESIQSTIGISWTAPRQEVTIANDISCHTHLADGKHTIVPDTLRDGWVLPS